jgi:hypothetical protein
MYYIEIVQEATKIMLVKFNSKLFVCPRIGETITVENKEGLSYSGKVVDVEHKHVERFAENTYITITISIERD